jgi:hypothetical protein
VFKSYISKLIFYISIGVKGCPLLVLKLIFYISIGVKGCPLLVLKRKCREKGQPFTLMGNDLKKVGVII